MGVAGAVIHQQQVLLARHTYGAPPGAAALNVDFAPFLARHAQGDWGDNGSAALTTSLDNFDRRQNDMAVKEGGRILSAYDVPTDDETERILIITEADRSATSIILPSEY